MRNYRKYAPAQLYPSQIPSGKMISFEIKFPLIANYTWQSNE
jgi:hypothetical protein